MSVMRCDYCENFIDTDYDVEGEYEDSVFRCSKCCQRRDEACERIEREEVGCGAP